MPNGKSQIGVAQEMATSVAQNLDEAADEYLPEYVQHLGNRKEELTALFEDSHQDGWKKVVDLLDVAAAAVKKAIERLSDGARIAKEIEERL